MKTFPEERQNEILKLLNSEGRATVQQLASRFEISIPTIRRDLAELEARDLISRSHGGALAREKVLVEISFEKRMMSFHAEKLRIAVYAESLVREGEVIILDTGTTTYLLATLLKKRKNITVITNSIKAASALAENRDFQCILVGGAVLSSTFSTYGSVAIENLRSFNVDTVFLGTAGFDWDKGLTEAYEEEAAMKREFVSVSRNKVVLADHSKFGKVLFSSVAPVSAISTIITDKGLRKEERKEEKRIRLVCV